jgi:hypothetical protein
MQFKPTVWMIAERAMPNSASSAGDVKECEPRKMTVKGPWTKEEDDVVIRLVGQYGPRRWSLIASNLPGRTGKQCRERWHNQLDPNINKEGWTEEEDYILAKAHTEVLCMSCEILGCEIGSSRG